MRFEVWRLVLLIDKADFIYLQYPATSYIIYSFNKTIKY